MHLFGTNMHKFKPGVSVFFVSVYIAELGKHMVCRYSLSVYSTHFSMDLAFASMPFNSDHVRLETLQRSLYQNVSDICKSSRELERIKIKAETHFRLHEKEF